MAERARIARYWVLEDACNQYDRPHLLLGHHALDQAETVMIRVLGGSASRGLAGMAALAETGGARLLRPLLGVTPAALRHFLTRQRMEWVEDPSNASLLARRSRLRRIHADSGGIGAGTHAILAAVANAGRMRAESDRRVARILAERVTIRPEGFAIVSPGTIDPDVLSALIRTIGGLAYPPPATAVAALSRDLRPATLAGIRVQAAGRLGTGWLLTREVRAIGEPVEGRFGAVWDGRFRLLTSLPPGFTLGALAQDAVRLRRQSPLPASVLHTLPALRYGNMLAAVPHLDYRDPAFDLNAAVVFDPPVAMAGAPFVPASAANTTCRGCETGGDTLC